MLNNSIYANPHINLELLNDEYLESENNISSNYFSAHTFNQEFTICDKDLSVVHCNIRSLNANGETFENYLRTLNHSFDAICLSETWSKDIDYLNTFFGTYIGFHSCRSGTQRGGGVSIFVKPRFHVDKLEDLCENSPTMECLFLKLSLGRKKLKVGCIYKPPNAHHDTFITNFESKIQNLNSLRGELVLTGDFNYDLMKVTTDVRCSDFYDCASSYSILPVITKPTHFVNASFSLLDNIFTSQINNIKSGILTFDVSDHLPVFIVYSELFCDINFECNRVKFRVLKDENMDKLFDEFSGYNLAFLYNLDIDSAIYELDKLVFKCYNNVCPIKTKHISYKDETRPWIDNEIKILIKKRQNLFVLHKLNRISRLSYTSYRNYVTSIIRSAKKTYYENKFNSIKGNIKQMWNVINNLIQPKLNKKKLSS